MIHCAPWADTIFLQKISPLVSEHQIPVTVLEYWISSVKPVASFQIIPIVLQDLDLLYHLIQYDIF